MSVRGAQREDDAGARTLASTFAGSVRCPRPRGVADAPSRRSGRRSGSGRRTRGGTRHASQDRRPDRPAWLIPRASRSRSSASPVSGKPYGVVVRARERIAGRRGARHQKGSRCLSRSRAPRGSAGAHDRDGAVGRRDPPRRFPGDRFESDAPPTRVDMVARVREKRWRAASPAQDVEGEARLAELEGCAQCLSSTRRVTCLLRPSSSRVEADPPLPEDVHDREARPGRSRRGGASDAERLELGAVRDVHGEDDGRRRQGRRDLCKRRGAHLRVEPAARERSRVAFELLGACRTSPGRGARGRTRGAKPSGSAAGVRPRHRRTTSWTRG